MTPSCHQQWASPTKHLAIKQVWRSFSCMDVLDAINTCGWNQTRGKSAPGAAQAGWTAKLKSRKKLCIISRLLLVCKPSCAHRRIQQALGTNEQGNGCHCPIQMSTILQPGSRRWEHLVRFTRTHTTPRRNLEVVFIWSRCYSRRKSRLTLDLT